MNLQASRTVLGNGLTVLAHTDRTAPVVSIVTRVNAGYFDEPDEDVGISHVLEHMYFKGTPTRGVGEIARETKASGGYLNAHTIYDNTTYDAVLPASSFRRGLEIQADAFANSLIDAGELARELEVIIQEARRKLDSPGAVAVESLYAMLHDRHRMRRWRIGEETGLRSLDRERLLSFYRNFYRPRNTIIAVVGDVDEDAALAEVELRYGHLPDAPVERTSGPPETDSPGFRFKEKSGDVTQAQVAMGWRTPGPLDPDTPALDFAASLLGDGRGSRLYRGVRERQLASHAFAMNYTPRDTGVFVIRTEGDPARARKAAGAAWAAMDELRSHPAPASDVLRVKRMFEARWLRRMEPMEGRAEVLVEWEALGGIDLAQEYLDAFMALTPGAVREAVERHLDPDEASLLVYRPSSAPVFEGEVDVRAAIDRLAHGAAVPPLAVVRDASRQSTPTIHAQLEERVGPVAVFRTASAMPLLVRRRTGAPLVHIGFYAPVGGAAEPDDVAGIGTLMARASVKGTATRNADTISSESEMLGGSVATSVTSDATGWTISVPTPRWREALDLLQDVVQSAVFPADAIDVERAIAFSQLAQLRDDMFRYPMRLALQAAFPGHPYGRSLLGSEESLGAIDAGAIRSWHRDHVLARGCVAALVGDVDEAEAASALASAFRLGAPSEPTVLTPPAWPTHASLRAETRAKEQSALAIAFPAPWRADPRRHAAELVCGIASGLGGRFFEELREKRSLAYTVQVFTMQRPSAGVLMAYIATDPAREEEARAALLGEFDRFREVAVSSDELTRAARYAVGSAAISRQSGGVVLGEMVDAWLFGEGLEETEEYEARISRVTAEEIRALAEKSFDPERRAEGVVRGRKA